MRRWRLWEARRRDAEMNRGDGEEGRTFVLFSASRLADPIRTPSSPLRLPERAVMLQRDSRGLGFVIRGERPVTIFAVDEGETIGAPRGPAPSPVDLSSAGPSPALFSTLPPCRLADSSAARNGLRAGDSIVAVNGQNVTDMDNLDVASLLRDCGEMVHMTVSASDATSPNDDRGARDGARGPMVLTYDK